MRCPARSEAEEFVGEAASGESFLYGGIAGVFTSTFWLLTCRFDPLALFEQRERQIAAVAAVAAAGGSYCHCGSGRGQPRGCLRP